MTSPQFIQGRLLPKYPKTRIPISGYAIELESLQDCVQIILQLLIYIASLVKFKS